MRRRAFAAWQKDNHQLSISTTFSFSDMFLRLFFMNSRQLWVLKHILPNSNLSIKSTRNHGEKLRSACFIHRNDSVPNLLKTSGIEYRESEMSNRNEIDEGALLDVRVVDWLKLLPITEWWWNLVDYTLRRIPFLIWQPMLAMIYWLVQSPPTFSCLHASITPSREAIASEGVARCGPHCNEEIIHYSWWLRCLPMNNWSNNQFNFKLITQIDMWLDNGFTDPQNLTPFFLSGNSSTSKEVWFDRLQPFPTFWNQSITPFSVSDLPQSTAYLALQIR